MMCRQAVRLLVLALLAVVAASRATAADVFLSPEATVGAGYDDNRFQSPDPEGSAWIETVPGLRALAMLAGGWEAEAAVFYRLADYTDRELSRTETTSAHAGVSRLRGALESGLWGDAGVFDDGVFDADDCAWQEVSAYFGYTVRAGPTASLNGHYGWLQYDSRETFDGPRQRDRTWELRPGIQWPLRGGRLTPWADVRFEGLSSNEDAAEYTGWGVRVGVDARTAERLRAGAWVQWRAREFDSSSGAGEDRLSVGGWLSYRWTPGTEILARTAWEDVSADDAAGDYSRTTVFLGMRFVLDWQVHSGVRWP